MINHLYNLKMNIEQLTEKGINTLKRLDGLRSLASVPKIIFEVGQFIKTEPGNLKKLARMIEKDQGLTTKILSVANSPLYGLQRKVPSLEFALMVMGSEEVARMVTAISLSESLKFQAVDNFKYLDYWKHCMIVGTASKDMSIRLGFSDLAGESFLAGMLHDIGVQVIAQYFNKEFKEILDRVSAGKKYYVAEQEVLGVSHAQIGKVLSLKWKLPDYLAEALDYHHQPSKSETNKILCAIVHLADSMTQEFRVGDCIWDRSIAFDGDTVEILKFASAEAMSVFVSEYNEIFIDTADSIVL
jgi:HD-like signal output (HDOD) protein